MALTSSEAAAGNESPVSSHSSFSDGGSEGGTIKINPQSQVTQEESKNPQDEVQKNASAKKVTFSDPEEFNKQAQAALAFKEADTNGDGVVDEDEFQAYIAKKALNAASSPKNVTPSSNSPTAVAAATNQTPTLAKGSAQAEGCIFLKLENAGKSHPITEELRGSVMLNLDEAFDAE